MTTSGSTDHCACGEILPPVRGRTRRKKWCWDCEAKNRSVARARSYQRAKVRRIAANVAPAPTSVTTEGETQS